jgi:cold shock CspA family protein
MKSQAPVLAGRTLKGTVMSCSKNFGFIKPDSQAHDAFFLPSAIVGEIFEGARVEFDCLQSKTVRGRYHARRIKVVS